METITIILAVTSIFTTILIFVLGLLYAAEKRRVGRIEQEQIKIWQTTHSIISQLSDFKVEVLKSFAQITSNYLTRFDGIRNLITTNHEEQIRETSAIRSLLEQQVTFCKYVQNNKSNSAPK